MLLEKTFLISELGVNNGRYIIKDEAGLSYSFFEKKQNGDFTKAYQDFKNKNIAVNDTIRVQYQENSNGKTTYRNIMTIDVADKCGVSPINKSANEIKEDIKTAGMVRHHFALEAFKKEKELNHDLADAIQKWVDYVISGKIK